MLECQRPQVLSAEILLTRDPGRESAALSLARLPVRDRAGAGAGADRPPQQGARAARRREAGTSTRPAPRRPRKPQVEAPGRGAGPRPRRLLPSVTPVSWKAGPGPGSSHRVLTAILLTAHCSIHALPREHRNFSQRKTSFPGSVHIAAGCSDLRILGLSELFQSRGLKTASGSHTRALPPPAKSRNQHNFFPKNFIFSLSELFFTSQQNQALSLALS